jgi:5-methylcytosine-specific restriction endonuclease McrA
MKAYPIPDEALIHAANETARHFGCCADNWGEKEAAYCRDVCGEEYVNVETDYIRRRSITLRKAGKLESVAGGAKRKKKEGPTGKYADYLNSPHWKEFRLLVMAFWSGECCLCTSDAQDVHHRHYRTIGNESLTDCVPLCRQCHTRVHGVLPSGNDALNGGNGDELF